LAVGDIDRDGYLDLLATNKENQSLIVLRGLGDGTFSNPISYPVGPDSYGIAVGDINGDGWLDAVTANYGGNDVAVLWNGGTVCGSK
jgi:hypothetical protein